MSEIPRGRVLKISMEVVVNCDVDEADALEFIESELTQSGGYSIDNPLAMGGFESLYFDMEDTKEFVSFSASNVRREGNSTTYRMSKARGFDRRSAEEIAAWKCKENVRKEAFANLDE